MIDAFEQQPERRWRYFSDQVMGGLSQGQASFVKTDARFSAHLSGWVTTQNNGGFIQFRANVSFDKTGDQGQMIKGVRLTGRGNGAKYFIHFRTSDNRRPSDYYF